VKKNVGERKKLRNNWAIVYEMLGATSPPETKKKGVVSGSPLLNQSGELQLHLV